MGEGEEVGEKILDKEGGSRDLLSWLMRLERQAQGKPPERLNYWPPLQLPAKFSEFDNPSRTGSSTLKWQSRN